MRLHTLTLVGIGPFTEKTTIDFRVFEDAGLFLIHGKTGSGKSSILDAIVFALYGDVASDGDRSKDRMRSHHLDYKEKSYVELVFGTPKGTYRIYRDCPKISPTSGKSLTGSTTLVEVQPEEDGTFTDIHPFSGNKTEANAYIRELVGLTRAQFMQTILLPQGRFAEFLSAKSKERQAILQSIFGTQRFDAYQDTLVEKAREKTAEFRQGEHQLIILHQNAHAAFNAVAGQLSLLNPQDSTDAPDGDLADTFPDISAEESCFSELKRFLQESLDAVEKTLKATLKESKKAQQEASDAKEQSALLQEKNSLLEHQKALLEEKPQIDALNNRIKDAQRVAPLMEPLTFAESSWRNLVRAQAKTHDSLCTIRERYPDDIPHDFSTLTQWCEEQKSHWQELITRLETQLPLEKEQEEVAQKIAQKTKEEESAQELLTQKRTQHVSLPDRLKEASDKLQSAKIDAARCNTARERLDSLRQRLEYAQKAHSISKKLSQLKSHQKKALADANAAHENALEMRRRWLADAAASLAAELTDNTPCAVCGSLEHPNPAHEQSTDWAPISRDDVEKAQKDSSLADQKLDEVRQKFAEYSEQYKEFLARADGTEESLNSELTEAQKDLDLCLKAEKTVPKLQSRIDALHQEEEKVNTEIISIEKRVSALSAEIQQLGSQQLTQSLILETARGSFSSVAEHYESCKKELSLFAIADTRLEEYQQQLSYWNASRDNLETAYALVFPDDQFAVLHDLWEDLNATLPGGDFHTQILPKLLNETTSRNISAATKLALPSEEIDAAHQRISRHQLETHQVCDRLADNTITALTGNEEATYQALAAVAENKQNLYVDLLQKQSSAQTSFGHYLNQTDSYLSMRQQIEQDKQEFAPLDRLAKLASASSDVNPSRIPLRTWVLISLFKDVLAAANHHLRRISNGRYEMCHSLGARGSEQHGLELSIIDHEFDIERNASTLSGGESFYCSLSLALGLAEIVTGENGGIELKSMFIDEGFGSLDSETLDNVMNTFHDLHADGRLIGVISHVSEMLSHIPEKIRVEKKEHGSVIHVEA